MALKVMADNGEQISASQDGALYDALGQSTSYVIDGMGNNLVVGYNAASLNITIGTGEGVIRGRHVTNTASISLTLPANSYRYIVLRYDSSSDTVTAMAVTSTTNGNINNSQSTTADLVLAYVHTSASGVDSYTDRRELSSNLFVKYTKVYVRLGRNTPSETANLANAGALCICAGSGYMQFWVCQQSDPSSFRWYCLGRIDGTSSYGTYA